MGANVSRQQRAEIYQKIQQQLNDVSNRDYDDEKNTVTLNDIFSGRVIKIGQTSHPIWYSFEIAYMRYSNQYMLSASAFVTNDYPVTKYVQENVMSISRKNSTYKIGTVTMRILNKSEIYVDLLSNSMQSWRPSFHLYTPEDIEITNTEKQATKKMVLEMICILVNYMISIPNQFYVFNSPSTIIRLSACGDSEKALSQEELKNVDPLLLDGMQDVGLLLERVKAFLAAHNVDDMEGHINITSRNPNEIKRTKEALIQNVTGYYAANRLVSYYENLGFKEYERPYVSISRMKCPITVFLQRCSEILL